MTTIIKPKNYKSFEQLKAELFPQLVEDERNSQERKDIEQFAINLANKSFDDVLSKRENKTLFSV